MIGRFNTEEEAFLSQQKYIEENRANIKPSKVFI